MSQTNFTNKKSRIISLLLITYLLNICFICSCSANQKFLPYTVVEPTWSEPPIRITSRVVNREYPSKLEFSPDGNLLCVVWPREPSIVVYDSKGSMVQDAVNSNGFLQKEYRNIFPKIALCSSDGIFAPHDTRRMSKKTEFEDIISGSCGWLISNDYKNVVVLTNKTLSDYSKKCEDGTWPVAKGEPEHEWQDVEYWQLEPQKKQLWSTRIQGKHVGIQSSGFFSVNETSFLFLNFFLDCAYVFRINDGVLIDKFEYGPQDTEEQILAKMKRYNLKDKSFWKSELKFTPSKFSFEPVKRLLACGDFHSRRIRVLSVDKPHNILFEAFAEANPMSDSNLFYDKGFWYTDKVEFAGDQFLIVDYEAAGRGRWRPIPTIFRTDIYKVGTWKRVWMKNSNSISGVTLSANGNKIAIIRNGIIEYGNFSSLKNNQPEVLRDDFK